MIKTPLGTAYETVGELIGALKEFPLDFKLRIFDADSGGYDVIEHSFCFVKKSTHEDSVYLSHLEGEMAGMSLQYPWYTDEDI